MIALNRIVPGPWRLIVLVLLLGYGIILYIGIPAYINVFSVNTVLGMMAIISGWQGAPVRKRISRWLVAVSVLLLLYAWIPSKFFLFAAIGMAVFSLMETAAGSAGKLALPSLVFMSPLCEYFTSVFGFPIRLQLTRMAGYILNVIDNGFHTEGNVILKGTTEFSVDTACMGLHMLISSLLCGMILLGIYQRRLLKKISFPVLIATGAAIFILNLFSNLVRIISLVIFQVAPENKMHATIGLFCFLVYVLLPSVVLVKWLVGRFGKNYTPHPGNFDLSPKTISVHISLLILIIVVAMTGKGRSVNEHIPAGSVTAPGYQIEKLPDAIVKMSTDKGLIYLKPVIGFYSSDHQPAICWKGSGYKFTNLKISDLDGSKIYTSCLENGKDKLYTAWWYDNGDLQTVSQFDWRWDSFRHNRAWVLVNVSAASEPDLLSQVRQLKKINPCRMLLRAE